MSVVMDHDDDEPAISSDDLVRRLVLEAGMLIEDISVDWALALPETQEERHERISSLVLTTDRIADILKAALSTNARRPGTDLPCD